MSKGKAEGRIVIRAPLERVFARFIDHEGMASWPGISGARLVREGTDKNGLGAVRLLKIGVLSVEEEIVAYDPPKRFEYAVTRGLPVDDHRGTVRFTDVSGAVEVDWHVRLSSPWPLVAPILGRALQGGLVKALAHLKKELERAQ